MTKQELLEHWNSVQIKINDAYSKGNWRDIDTLTVVTTGIIRQMIQEGHDELARQVLPC